jgi:hypothetical protein
LRRRGEEEEEEEVDEGNAMCRLGPVFTLGDALLGGCLAPTEPRF